MPNSNLINENEIPENLVPAEHNGPMIPGQVAAGAPPAPNDMPAMFSASLAPQIQHDATFIGTTPATPRIPKTSLMPFGVQGNPASNAGIQSTTKVIQNTEFSVELETNSTKNSNQGILNLKQGTGITLAADGSGGVTITGTSTGDGLTHGETPWETDPAFYVIREDFNATVSNVFNSGSATNAGTTGIAGGWWPVQNNCSEWNMLGGYPPYMGSLTWENNATASQGLSLIPNPSQGGGNGGALGIFENSYALLENPGWVATWIWKFDSTFQPTIGGVPAFTTTKKSFYVGLCGSNQYSQLGTIARPDTFIGIRYDTSVSPGTFTLSSVAAASGGNTVYTGTITGGANHAYIGMSFVVTGFVGGATVNNGTFTCVASSATTLTLNNAVGVGVTAAGSAAGPAGIGDTTYMFEVVENPYSYYNIPARHNVQGQTSNTTIAPTKAQWCRLDISCVIAGQVVMTLTTDGGTSATHTFTVNTMAPAYTSVLVGVSGGLGYGQCSISVSNPPSTNWIPPFSAGSQIVLGGTSPYNGSYTLSTTDSGGSSNSLIKFCFPSAASTGSGTYNTTLTGYPSLLPYLSFGNDDTASPTGNTMKIFIDYFSLVWNPTLRTSGGTPDSTKPRFW